MIFVRRNTILQFIDGTYLLFKKVNVFLIYWIKITIAFLLSGMSICILLAVISRYVIKMPIPWTEEMARYLMIWVAFLSGSLGLRRGVHVGIVFLVRQTSRNLQLLLSIVGRILMTVFFIFVIYQGFKLTGLVARQLSPAMRISMSRVYISLPISSLFFVSFNIQLLIDDFVNLTKKI